MIYNSRGRTNVIVRLSLCVIAHHVMKSYGKAEFKLHAFLTSREDREEWWNSRLGRFILLQWADANYWRGDWVGRRADIDAAPVPWSFQLFV
jgi:hypothetical protein